MVRLIVNMKLKDCGFLLKWRLKNKCLDSCQQNLPVFVTMSNYLKNEIWLLWPAASFFLEESKLIPEHNICNIWFLHYFSLPLPASGDRLTWNVAKSTKTVFPSLFLHYVLNYKFWYWAAQYFSMYISIHFNMYLNTHIQHVSIFIVGC